MGVGRLGRGHAFPVVGVQPAVADVVHHRAGEQMGILQHHAGGPAQMVFFDVPDVDAVVGDGAAVDLVKAGDQIDDGGLARAGGAHQGDLLARLGVEGDVGQHLLFRHVGKVHVTEAHVAPERHQTGAVLLRLGFLVVGDIYSRRDLPGPFAGAGLRFRHAARFVHVDPDQGHGARFLFDGLVDQGEDAFRAGQSGQDGVDLLADLGDGIAEIAAVEQEGADGAQVHAAGDGQGRAGGGDHGVGQVGQVAHDGHEDAGKGVGVLGRAEQLVVFAVEAVPHRLLVVEHLDHLDAGDHLLDVAVQVAQLFLLPGEIGGGAFAHEFDHEHHDAQHGQDDQGQQGRKHQHHHEDADDGEARAEDVGQ